jgi:hypothetical protein
MDMYCGFFVSNGTVPGLVHVQHYLFPGPFAFSEGILLVTSTVIEYSREEDFCWSFQRI